eukprot:scaffold10238_cov276-Chaetoceros_neogracile.AAC.17
MTNRGIRRRSRKNGGGTASNSDTSTTQTAEMTETNLEEAYKLYQIQRNKEKNKKGESIPGDIMLVKNDSSMEFDTNTDAAQTAGWGNYTKDTNAGSRRISEAEANRSQRSPLDSSGTRRTMSKAAVKKDESKLKKIFVRLFFGILMLCKISYGVCILALFGHVCFDYFNNSTWLHPLSNQSIVLDHPRTLPHGWTTQVYHAQCLQRIVLVCLANHARCIQ